MQWLDGCSSTSAGVCRECDACPDGLFRIDCELLSPGYCGVCPDGYWVNHGKCQSCESGVTRCGESWVYYNDRFLGGQQRSNCGGDDPGTCACPPGTYRTPSEFYPTRAEFDTCRLCPADTYNSLWGERQCPWPRSAA